jgi:5'-AMP-activated protein kinase catalytic alpha subunit
LDAFHIISFSKGFDFDLLPLFEEKKEGLSFAMTRPTSSVVSRLEVVATKAVKFNVKKSESKVRFQGHESGRKGKLAIAMKIFVMM